MAYNIFDAMKRPFASTDARQELGEIGNEQRAPVRDRDNVHRAGAPVAPAATKRPAILELLADLREVGVDSPFAREGMSEELRALISTSDRPRIEGEPDPWTDAADLGWVSMKATGDEPGSAAAVISLVRASWPMIGAGAVPTDKTVRNRLRERGITLPGERDPWDALANRLEDSRAHNSLEFVGTSGDLEDRIYGDDEP